MATVTGMATGQWQMGMRGAYLPTFATMDEAEYAYDMGDDPAARADPCLVHQQV